MLLVFQSWASFTGGSRGLVVPRPFPGMLRPEHHRVFFYLFAGLLGARAAGVVADRPVPVRPGPQGDPGGRGQGRVAGYADVHVQAGGLRRVRGLHRAGRRALRALVRRPRPGVPVLHPHRRVHGADGAARRGAQPLRAAARGVGGRHRAGVLQGGVRQHAAAPRRHRPAARPGRDVHAGRHPAGGRRAGQPLPSTAELDPRDDRRRTARRACVHRARAAPRAPGAASAAPGAASGGVTAASEASGPPAVANSGGRKEDRHERAPHAGDRRPHQGVRRRGRARRGDGFLPARQGERADRPERLGQDDVLQLRHRDDPAGQRADDLSGPGHHPPDAARDRAGRHRAHASSSAGSSRG